jgi:hypothetical protein
VIGIIVVMVLSITIGIIWIIQNNKSIKRTKELEDILNRYYEQRKQRLKDKGLID